MNEDSTWVECPPISMSFTFLHKSENFSNQNRFYYEVVFHSDGVTRTLSVGPFLRDKIEKLKHGDKFNITRTIKQKTIMVPKVVGTMPFYELTLD